MTLREALGGPWASHWLLWAGLYPPSTLLVLLSESTTVYPQWWWPWLSATIQYLVTGVVLVGGAAVARRRSERLPLGVFGALWVIAAIVRGLVGAAVAEVVAGVDGELVLRIAAWLVASAAWIPAIVFAIAQILRRRELIGELEAAQRSVDTARREAVDSGDAIRARLAISVKESIDPVLHDLRHRLTAAHHDLDVAAFGEISTRLSNLLDETSRLVDAPRAAPAPATAETGRRPEIAPRRPALREAFDVPLDRPWSIAGLVLSATLALLLPDAARIFGALAAAETAVATSAAGLVLALIFVVGHRLSSPAARCGVVLPLTAVAAAMLVSVWLMLSNGIDPVAWHAAVLIPLLLGGLFSSFAVVATALGLSCANDADDETLRDRLAEARSLRDAHDRTLESERSRLSELMHGPIHGRLAACVMALAFFSGADADPGHLASITDQVLDHLSAASRDLTLLAEQSRLSTPPN